MKWCSIICKSIHRTLLLSIFSYQRKDKWKTNWYFNASLYRTKRHGKSLRQNPSFVCLDPHSRSLVKITPVGMSLVEISPNVSWTSFFLFVRHGCIFIWTLKGMCTYLNFTHLLWQFDVKVNQTLLKVIFIELTISFVQLPVISPKTRPHFNASLFYLFTHGICKKK